MKLFANINEMLGSRTYVIKSTQKAMGISKSDAEKRVNALLKSGILDDGGLQDRMTQLLIENFLRFDICGKLDYQQVWFSTLSFTALLEEYDRKEKRQIREAMRQVRAKEPLDRIFVKNELEHFDRFFCEKIWNRFPNVEKYTVNQ